jgi:DNA-binding response OmpR family regulator
LVAEDDAALRERLTKMLTGAGFAVDGAGDGIEAEFMGSQEPYDAVVLDLGLPKRSGLDVLRNWRAAGNPVVVLLLTARGEWFERVEGFKAGADDYLGKPFHMEELVVRLQALVRRGNRSVESTVINHGLVMDDERQTVTRADGGSVQLSGVEYRLLRYFMVNPGKVLSKTRLTEHVYARDSDKDSNVIEVYVNRLRNKLGKELIVTRRGQGYVFGDRHP